MNYLIPSRFLLYIKKWLEIWVFLTESKYIINILNINYFPNYLTNIIKKLKFFNLKYNSNPKKYQIILFSDFKNKKFLENGFLILTKNIIFLTYKTLKL